MRTEAQKRVCEAFEQLVRAHQVRDASRAIVNGMAASPLAEAVLEEANGAFLDSLNAVIDERKGVQS